MSGAAFAGVPVPPPMPERPIAKRENLPVVLQEIEVDGRKATLATTPRGVPANVLTLHFHGAGWHAFQEHLDRGLTGPLLFFELGQGSSVYAAPFQVRGSLAQWVGTAERALGLRPGHFETFDVTSFSAGYGAVRQIIQDPDAFARLRRVILCDSLYGSLDPRQAGRVVLAEHAEVWMPLARAAMAGAKTFVITHSDVPTSEYASSSEVAAAIVRLAGGELNLVERGDFVATLDAKFPLRARFDQGAFHVWRYGGSDGPAHVTHVRHLADVWKALDSARRP